MPLPPVDRAHSVELTPESYRSWDEMLAANPTAVDYLLRPGDYTGWGRLDVRGRAGTAERPIVVRYYNPGVDDQLHPSKRRGEARVDGILVHDPDAMYWTFHGLTARAAALWSTDADHTTWDWCLVEKSDRVVSIRVSASHVTVQRCVMRDSVHPFARDAVAVQVRPVEGRPVTDVKILDNEMYNYSDGVQLTKNAREPETEMDALIEGNDIYTTPDQYLPGGTANVENAIDIKGGNDSIPTIIRGNRMWGFRRNGKTAIGDIIVLHQYARNIVIEDNVIADAPSGIREAHWPKGVEMSRPRNIVVRRNRFYDIHKMNGEDTGAAVHPTSNTRYTENVFVGCDYAVDAPPPAGYRAAGPTFEKNVRVRTEAKAPGARFAPFDEERNLVLRNDKSWRAEQYRRRRWTGAAAPAAATARSSATN